MDRKDIEKDGEIYLNNAKRANDFFWKKKKYQLLVPYFGTCYRWINPGRGKKFVILRNGRKIRGDFQVENVASMVLLKWFWDYNGTMGKLKNYELFMACGQALDKSSHYYELRGSNFGNERLPTIYENYIKYKDKEYLDNISFKKYSQYITKQLFMDCLVRFFENAECAQAHRNPGDNLYTYLPFFTKGITNFFKSLRYKDTFFDKISEENQKIFRKSDAFAIIMSALDELLTGEIYCGEGDHASVREAWQALYKYDPKKIIDRMYGVEDNSLSYDIVDV